MDLQTRANNLLINLNIHPPPNIENVINSKNFKKSSRRHGNYTGFKLLRFNVANKSKLLGENNPFIISKISNFLWENSTKREKSEYIDLAKRIKALLRNKKMTIP
ncbi:hypothetical protein Glove_283g33 [Diversispora epigaea]|uniref:HMG box domain-containing protein n=1 Tax=Diversispora epigaea TaxID=1348612 RepID=A0A397I5E3_9GLOM|nr:hypothetical protein Glove_283g33 [Diversispora epigaea]